MSTEVDLRQHLKRVASATLRGNVVPVLGAGANLCDRAGDEGWTRGSNLPNGGELAKWLADELSCDVVDDGDLLRVSQYADVTLGNGPLYEQLREIFNNDCYPIPTLHRFLAGLPARMERSGLPRRHQLIVTTNYDDLLERALRDAGEPFDVVRYLATGSDSGRFAHEPNDPESSDADSKERTASRVIRVPRKSEVSPELRTVVLKIHGGFDRHDASHDSYVITEDDYIAYLTRTSPNDLLPAKLLAKLLNSHFLFLGYAMRDWNLRVLLHRIWALRDLRWNSWAIQRDVELFDEKLWDKRGVELCEVLLSDYVGKLSACIDNEINELVSERTQEATGGALG